MVPDEYLKVAVCLTGSLAALRTRVEARAAAGGREIPLEVSERQVSVFTEPDFDEGFDRILRQEVAESTLEPDFA